MKFKGGKPKGGKPGKPGQKPLKPGRPKGGVFLHKKGGKKAEKQRAAAAAAAAGGAAPAQRAAQPAKPGKGVRRGCPASSQATAFLAALLPLAALTETASRAITRRRGGQPGRGQRGCR